MHLLQQRPERPEGPAQGRCGEVDDGGPPSRGDGDGPPHALGQVVVLRGGLCGGRCWSDEEPYGRSVVEL